MQRSERSMRRGQVVIGYTGERLIDEPMFITANFRETFPAGFAEPNQPGALVIRIVDTVQQPLFNQAIHRNLHMLSRYLVLPCDVRHRESPVGVKKLHDGTVCSRNARIRKVVVGR